MEMDALLQSLDYSDPNKCAEVIRQYMPALVEKYGSANAELGAEWYELCRSKEINSGFTAIVNPTSTDNSYSIRQKAGFLCGRLFDGTDVESFKDSIEFATVAYVQRAARDAIMANLSEDYEVLRKSSKSSYRETAEHIGYARIPTGDKTCAWCLMLASRGFVYWSEDSAMKWHGRSRHHSDDRYHDHCRCTVVPAWSEDHAIEGYDPAEYYDMYSQARKHTEGELNDKNIAATMRSMFGLN